MSKAHQKSVSNNAKIVPVKYPEDIGIGRFAFIRECLFGLVLLLPFIVLSLTGVLNHEPWRDETHNVFFPMWIESVFEIFSICNQTGAHPPLWYLIMRGWSFFSDSFFSVALLHWSIMFVALILLVRFSPFKWYEKILISLSYFFLYEYCVLVRNYGINVLFLFMILAMYSKRLDHLMVFSGLIALLAFSNLFGAILGSAITVVVMYEAFRARRPMWAFFVPIASILISIYICTPPAYGRELLGLETVWPGLGMIVTNLVVMINKVFFVAPIIALFGQAPWLGYITAPAFLLLFLVLAPRHRTSAIYFFLSSALLLAFYTFKGNGMGIRHQGFFFVNLIYAMWLDHCYPNDSELIRINFKFAKPGRSVAFVFILLLQAWAGVNAVVFDYKHIYSDAQNAGENFGAVLEGKDPAATLIATFYSSSAEGLQGFLGSDKFEFYSLEMMKPYRIITDWAEWAPVEPLSTKYTLQEIIERFMSLAMSSEYKYRYLIFPAPINVQFKNGMRLTPVYQTMRPDVAWSDERFYIYRLDVDHDLPRTNSASQQQNLLDVP